MNTRKTAAIATCLLAATIAHAGSIAYVDDDAPLGGDGQSWATAYRYLQDALYVSAPDTLEIRIAQGVYRPDQDEAGLIGESPSFGLDQTTAMRGGYRGAYDGSGENPDDRLIDVFETTLNGLNLYRLIAVATDVTTLEGLTITRGRMEDENGGGILYPPDNDEAVHLVLNCQFIDNLGSYNPGTYGAAVYGGSPRFEDCCFYDNSTRIGGAFSGESPYFEDCYFEGNIANVGGGAVHAQSPEFIHCTFCFNETNSKGGAAVWAEGPAVYESCLFESNI